jgi:hypothetical protein
MYHPGGRAVSEPHSTICFNRISALEHGYLDRRASMSNLPINHELNRPHLTSSLVMHAVGFLVNNITQSGPAVLLDLLTVAADQDRLIFIKRVS